MGWPAGAHGIENRNQGPFRHLRPDGGDQNEVIWRRRRPWDNVPYARSNETDRNKTKEGRVRLWCVCSWPCVLQVIVNGLSTERFVSPSPSLSAHSCEGAGEMRVGFSAVFCVRQRILRPRPPTVQNVCNDVIQYKMYGALANASIRARRY